ncbi:MAG: peptidoglycan editing factor PgeF [Vibrionaceae bacterium]
MPDLKVEFITPNWPAAAHVKALSTTRAGGVSLAPFAGLNLAHHVGDKLSAVEQNRNLLVEKANLPAMPLWITQTHSTDVVTLPFLQENAPQADAVFTDQAGLVCAVVTADCLPVLFCDKAGTQIAAAHAGWRGLLDGILEATVAKFTQPSDLLAWFGPAIGPQAFEVGAEVRADFIAADPRAKEAFVAKDELFLADLYHIARLRLQRAGVPLANIYGGERCTYSEPAHFFSFRRANTTGRQATCIWLTK